MRLTVKIGHSLFKHPINVSEVKEMAKTIGELHDQGHEIVVIVGGGSIARDYIEAVRQLGSNWSEADLVGIHVSRLNARLMSLALGERAFLPPISDVEQVLLPLQLGKIAIAGGLTPGHSTDAVAALASEVIGAELFIKTMDVGGIYDKDPKRFADAKILKRIGYGELRRIVLSSHSSEAGEYSPLDLVALEILGRSKIPAIFIGPTSRYLMEAVAGREVGTKLVYE